MQVDIDHSPGAIVWFPIPMRGSGAMDVKVTLATFFTVPDPHEG